MRAIRQTEFGGPEVLELVELPDPVAGPGEVVVDVTLAGVNFADIHQRQNQYVAGQELPRIPGAEVAGVLAGSDERVIALTPHGVGGYAEHVAVAADRVFPIPAGVEDATALALLVQGLTAWHLYTTCAHVEPGETVLVVSGAGGVGSLAVQLGAYFGARVLATASTEAKRTRCLELGASAALDHADPELLQRDLLDQTGGRGPDVVFEIAGGATFDACLRVLAEGGRIVPYGISSREQNEVRTGRLLKRSQSVIGFWLFHYLDRRRHCEQPLAELLALAAGGRLHAEIGGVYPLPDAGRAQVDLAARRTTGKLVLDVRPRPQPRG